MGNACPGKRVSKNDYYSYCTVPKEPFNEAPRVIQKTLEHVMLKPVTVLQTETYDQFDQIFSLGRNIGKGRYGNVFLCTERATGKEYACKSVEKTKLIRMEDLKDMRNEIRIMQHLAGNPYVASIQGAYEDDVAVHIVMEFCKGGELFDRIKKRGHYNERDAAELISTIVSAVKSLHSSGVMHRDLKPEHFLFVDHKEDSHFKMIDFGLSTFFKPDEKFRDPVGTASYAAPEVLQKWYGSEADIWSVGVILYILLRGYNPFGAETQEAMHQNVLNKDLDFLSDPWPTISESAKDLLRRMLDRDPSARPSIDEILCHHWLQIHGVVPDEKHAGSSSDEDHDLEPEATVMNMESNGHVSPVVLKASGEDTAAGFSPPGTWDLLLDADADVNGYSFRTAEIFYLKHYKVQ